jgi:large subunit ribosomal protein L32e
MKFLRRDSGRYLRLGRKKKQTWRKPKGRDNKMREKRKGYPAVVSIGYSNEKKIRGKILGKESVIINNVKDLGKIKENQIIIIGKIGQKKRLEIAKIANEKKIEIYNLNVKKLIKKSEKKQNQGSATPINKGHQGSATPINKNKEKKK